MQSEILIFKDGSASFALRLNEVKEIINLRRIVPLPFTANFILGLTSLRGQVVPIVSPYLFLRGKGRYLADIDYAAVIECEGMQVALACQKVVGVKNVSGADTKSADLVVKILVDGKKLPVLNVRPVVYQTADSIQDERYSHF